VAKLRLNIIISKANLAYRLIAKLFILKCRLYTLSGLVFCIKATKITDSYLLS